MMERATTTWLASYLKSSTPGYGPRT
jgi:hypothetical protein